MLRFTISLYLILVAGAFNLSAQEAENVPLDKRDWKPSVVFFSADVVKLIDMAASNDLNMEFNFKTDFDQLFLAFDFGLENQNLSGEGFDYHSEGRFYRIGPQINFMKYNQERSNIFFGISYAAANLSDNIDYHVAEGVFDEAQLQYSNVNLKAHWFELNTGLSVRVAGPIFLGYTVRFKLAKSMDTPSKLTPFNIPGYGDASKDSRFGFNYYVTYKLGFRKKKIPQKPKGRQRLEKVPTNDIKPE